MGNNTGKSVRVTLQCSVVLHSAHSGSKRCKLTDTLQSNKSYLIIEEQKSNFTERHKQRCDSLSHHEGGRDSGMNNGCQRANLRLQRIFI